MHKLKDPGGTENFKSFLSKENVELKITSVFLPKTKNLSEHKDTFNSDSML